MINDHTTPKIKSGGGITFTLESRDYKGAMVVVIDMEKDDDISESNRQPDGE